MKQLSNRLTYANVVSSLALFLVLTGATAFAAVQLGKNSVGSKQLKKNAVTSAKIKKNAVTTAKIKKNAVTGAKVKESSLGTVPSATTAGTAGVANSLPPVEPTRLVGTAGQPAFEGGSANYPGESGLSFNPVGFYKDHQGIVHLQGIAKVGEAGPAGTVFTLPPGFRPATGKLLLLSPYAEAIALIAGTGVATEGVDLSGKVLGEPGGVVVLDNISFRAES